MKRFWTALAVVAGSVFAAVGCNDYGNTFQVPTGAALTSLSPSTVPAGSATFTLTLNGSGFIKNTVVQWNGKTISTTLTTDSAGNVTGVTATVDASLVAKQGTAFVNTLSPHSGSGTNGLSNTLSFVINPPANPLPVVTSISPSCAVAGGASSTPLTLTVNGSSFLLTSDPSGGSQVRWTAGATQSTLPIVGITASQVQATVSASLIAAAGGASVSVYNPPSPQTAPPGQVPNPGAGGGGSSTNTPAFTIVAAGSTCPVGTTGATASAFKQVTAETPAVSVDGRYVVYSAAQDGHTQVFVRDTCQGASSDCVSKTLLLSTASDGTPGNDDSQSPSITADGRYVAFSSAATNLATDAPAGRQVYLRDTCFGVKDSCTPSTALVSKDENGALVGTESILPSISGSGRFVAFLAVTPSHSNNKAAAQTQSGTSAGTNSGFRQVFVRDTCLGAANCTPTTTRISLQPGDASSTETKPAGPAVSGAGQHVAVPEAQTATLFTSGVAVDDRVFLALTKRQ
jgi:hypothetical protein